jgi:hypothetical protein
MGRDSIPAKKAGKNDVSRQGEGKSEGNSTGLAAIQAATADLPEPIRVAILALVAAAQCQPAAKASKPARRKGERG